MLRSGRDLPIKVLEEEERNRGGGGRKKKHLAGLQVPAQSDVRKVRQENSEHHSIRAPSFNSLDGLVCPHFDASIAQAPRLCAPNVKWLRTFPTHY